MKLPTIPAPSVTHFAAAQTCLDAKTKPPRSLGRLEFLAARLCAIQNRETPDVRRVRAVLFAADHGVTACEAVSPYPREVTAQMVANFAARGAAAAVLARQNNVELQVVDVGVATPLPPLADEIPIFERRVRNGTRSFSQEAALTNEEVGAALQIGLEVGAQAASEGVGALVLGEMGIGNSSSAAALLSLVENAAPSLTTGRGTGVDDAGLERKIAVIERALTLHCAAQTPMAQMEAVGGLEIAALAGACLGAAAARVPVIVDGFIVTVAILWACRLVGHTDATQSENLQDALIFSHRSREIGHQLALRALNALEGERRPLLEWDMALGEGSGAIVVVPLLRAAGALFEMATFQSAGLSSKISL